jgi:hypothetical protein
MKVVMKLSAHQATPFVDLQVRRDSMKRGKPWKKAKCHSPRYDG